ncbi:MAG TPA: HTH-type transcriptional activator IlvY [Polyangiaceae bacterium]|nr:HTH-type transcriptional activator IlvY [Polyangiaceae bacterium]
MAGSTQQELSIFLHLAESLHFARSAKAAGMSPSALTRFIQRLEEELGQPLFQRTRRSVALTRAGEIFRDHARAQLAGHARLMEALAAEKQAPTGELRIACTVTACHSVLPKLFARCRSRFPGIHLQLSTSDAARCMQGLENDEVDLAVVPEPDQPANELRFVRLAHTDLSFIAPSSDAALARRAQLGGNHWNGLPVILPRRGLDRERIDAWLEEQNAEPEVYAEVDGNEAILAMVALGCGVGIVPELVRKDSPLRGRIELVEVRRPPRGYYVSLCAKNRTLSRRTAAALWELAPATASL